MKKGYNARRFVPISASAAALLVTAVFFLSGCVSPEVLATRQLEIQDLDISAAKDGTYTGDYTYGNFTYSVEVTIAGGKITSIVMLANRDDKHVILAEGVIPKVIAEQKTNVDVVTGATTTSKAILKAIENAVLKSLE